MIILTGDDNAIVQQLEHLVYGIVGDWLIVTEDHSLAKLTQQHYLACQAKQLLGSEFKHAIFDARSSFNLDALAILAGTLIANSLLILILPSHYKDWYDKDSLRWNESLQPITVPNFIVHLQSAIFNYKNGSNNNLSEISVSEHYPHDYLVNLINPNNRIDSDKQDYYCFTEQQKLLEQIIAVKDKIILVTAKRGRGKSALAGKFAHHHQCIVTAPNKRSVSTLLKFAPQHTKFIAPDELIHQLHNQNFLTSDWLIIDEAAMIPLPIIASLIKHFKHILLTTTIDGYEGTGQGLLLKLLLPFEHDHRLAKFELSTPIRWVKNDPLESFIDDLIVANYISPQINHSSQKIMVQSITPQEVVKDKLTDFFGLLKTAHYRTTLTDLRRILDASNVRLYIGKTSEYHLIAVLLTIKEGGLDGDLAEQILKGYRRPKGNLVAQSLVAFGGEVNAAKLHSIRINRIAVHHLLRKKGIATMLIKHLIADVTASHCDFISVSFAYSRDICDFWQKCGFTLIHIGTHQEASSGSYAAMAIYPISTAGIELCYTLQKKLARNWYWLQAIINVDLPVIADNNQRLTQQDFFELNLFATTSYSYSASFALLSRVVSYIRKESINDASILPLLINLVDNQFNEQFVINQYKLSGKSELLQLLRQEIFQFILMKKDY